MNLILLLLLPLTASWTGIVQCEEKEELESHSIEESQNQLDVIGSGEGPTTNSEPVNNEETVTDRALTDKDTNTEELNQVIMIIIPLVLTLVIIAGIVCAVTIYRKWKIKDSDTKDDPYLDNEDQEKVPMPIFEDDIPSVMELEMEDLENWMTKDGSKKVDTGQI